MKKEQHVTCKLPFVFECTHGTRKIQMIQHIIIFLKGWVREGWYSFDQEFFDYRHVGSNRLNHLIFVTEFILFYLCLCMAWSFPIFFFQLFIKRERGKKKQKVFLFGSCPKEDRWDRPPLLCAPQGRPPPSDAGSSLHPNRTWIYDSCAVLVLYLFTPTGNYYYYLRLNNKFTMTIKFVDIRWIK